MPFPEYVGSDPKHRQRYAIEMRQKAKHDMEIAHELYAKERALELVPDVPPWEQGDPDDILVDGYLEDRREWMRETRHFWRRDLADEYVIDRVLCWTGTSPPCTAWRLDATSSGRNGTSCVLAAGDTHRDWPRARTAAIAPPRCCSSRRQSARSA